MFVTKLDMCVVVVNIFREIFKARLAVSGKNKLGLAVSG